VAKPTRERKARRSRRSATVLEMILAAGAILGQQPAQTVASTLTTADVLEQARPAVVVVLTDADADDMTTQGSGFIVSSDGLVVTAWHVVAGARKAAIRREDGGYFPVEGLVAWDVDKDFAILKVAGKDLPTLPLGDSDRLRQGDRVLTLGSPWGLEYTASEGIVSAIRDLPDGGKLIQTTAPLSVGSSGGPLLDLQGRAVAVVCFKLEEGAALNFAVPINDVRTALRERGDVTPLGEAIADVPMEAAALFWLGVRALPADPEAPESRADLEKALRYFTEAVHTAPEWAEAHCALGGAYGCAGRRPEAIAALKEALRLRPSLASAHHLLGLAYAGLGENEEAIAAFKEALRLDPDYAHAHFGLGATYGSLGLLDEAVAACKEAIRLDPQLADAHAALGLDYVRLFRFEEAVVACKEAIRLEPNLFLAYTVLATAYAALGRDDEAIAACREALRLNPDSADAHYGVGTAYAVLGRYEESIAECKEAIRLNPKLVFAYYQLGTCYVTLGRHDEALDAYKRGVEVDPSNPSVHLGLGVVYSLKGQRRAALREYRILQDLDPNMAAMLERELLLP